MTHLVPVRFLARYAIYNENEVAGVPPDVAAQLIAQGRAEAYNTGAPVAGNADEVADGATDDSTVPPTSAEGSGEGDAVTDGATDAAANDEPATEEAAPPAEKTAKPAKGKAKP